MPRTARAATSHIREVALDELHVGHVRQVRALARDQTVHDADASRRDEPILHRDESR